MRAGISKDEWYPVYILELPDVNGYCYGEKVDVSDDLLARWKAVKDAFDDVQSELRHLYNGESK